MSLIVQKFGGTSLGNAEHLQNVVKIVKNVARQHSVIVVVSAMSSRKKSEGTTSRLIEVGQAALNSQDYSKILELIENTHFDLIDNAIRSKEIRDEVENSIHDELQHLKSFLEAIRVIQEISPRSKDLIVGTGERLSAQVITGILNDNNIKSVYTNLSEIAPHGISMDSKLNNNLQQLMISALPQTDKVIPVVTGFFGFVKGGIISGVGRGYTDFTAALIAGKLQAKELQIWKEVDGIYTANPHKVPSAHVLESIFPAEAAELTYFGSEVLHPFTMECAIAGSVPIRIKNTFAPEKPGTVILPKNQNEESFTHPTVSTKIAVAVTTKNDILVININSNRMLHSGGFLAKVFDIFQKHNVVIDLISTSEVNISCSIDSRDNLEKLERDLKKLGNVTIIHDRAILSLVGENMKHVPGVAGKMFTALAENQINIEMITQGASEINISCVIEEKEAQKALQVIHRTFLE